MWGPRNKIRTLRLSEHGCIFQEAETNLKIQWGVSRKEIADPEPNSISITFLPNDGRTYTVHIRPADQTYVLERKAYFTEGDLRATLAHCPLVDAEHVIA